MGAHRQRHQEFDDAGPALVRPEPHADRRHQDEEKPGVPGEERAEVGLSTLEETAGEKGEAGRKGEEYQEKNGGERRREIGAELATEHQSNGAE